MIKKALTFAFLFLISNANAQYFWGGGYSPAFLTEKDSIIIHDTVSIGQIDYRISESVQKSNDTVLLHICYKFAAGPTTSRIEYETTNIGTLPKGIYVLIIEGTYIKNNSCNSDDTFYNSISFPLEVFAAPNAISDIALSGVSISPTIVQEKIEISGLPNEIALIEVYDLQGKILHCISTHNSSTSLQIGSLTRGVYIVSVRIGNEQKRWKILKE